MKVLARLSRGLLATMLVGVVIATAAVIGWAVRDHGRLLSIQTTSMVPAIHKGDAVVEQAIDPKQLHIGNIVSYHSAVNPKMIITHRLIKIDIARKLFVTKGDHNREADQPIAASQIIGLAFAKAPAFGRVLDFEHTWLGLSLTIYTPVLAVAAWEMARLHQSSHQVHYRLPSWSGV